MGDVTGPLSGPDFSQGFKLADIKDGSMLLGHALGEAVILVRRGDQAFALGAFCTHYGGPLAEGIVTDEGVHCPWHHACFELKSGRPVSPPALNAVTAWNIERREGLVFVTGKKESSPAAIHGNDKETFVIIGAGAAGLVAAETLRNEGFQGRLLLLGEDEDGPYDRPNISKDYLAGNAPEEWIPLRSPDFYKEQVIELRTATSVESILPEKKSVVLLSGEVIAYDKLLIATGARPNRLSLPGSDLPEIHYLRSLADSRKIIEKAKQSKKAVVIGTGFVGLEVAASLQARGLEVAVVGKEKVPFERTLGSEIGGLVQSLHESKGVRFYLENAPVQFFKDRVVLSDGTSIESDLVVIGIGVSPSTELADKAGIRVDRGIVVDSYLETSSSGIFAAGDVARYPDPISGEKIRIEHWVLAQRQAKVAALNMMGRKLPFQEVPFFWSNHYDMSIGSTGYAAPGSERVVVGSVSDRDCLVAYRSGGKFTAVAAIGRDQDGLRIEDALRHGDASMIERYLN